MTRRDVHSRHNLIVLVNAKWEEDSFRQWLQDLTTAMVVESSYIVPKACREEGDPCSILVPLQAQQSLLNFLSEALPCLTGSAVVVVVA